MLCMYCKKREATKEVTVRGVRIMACDECVDGLLQLAQEPAEKVEREMLNIMERAGIEPQWRYAFQKTGRIVTADNMHLLSDGEIQEWDSAVREYFRHNKLPMLIVRISLGGQR